MDANDRRTSVLDRPRGQSSAPPRGWGSHEERRLVLWGAAAFVLLGLYAVVFVLLGQVLWS